MSLFPKKKVEYPFNKLNHIIYVTTELYLQQCCDCLQHLAYKIFNKTAVCLV